MPQYALGKGMDCQYCLARSHYDWVRGMELLAFARNEYAPDCDAGRRQRIAEMILVDKFPPCVTCYQIEIAVKLLLLTFLFKLDVLR